MSLEEQKEQEIGAEEQLGPYLKRIREAQGLPIDKLAKSVRLSVEMMKDIEMGNWDKFPIEAYTRSYLISLCDKFNLDKAVILERFNKECNSQYNVSLSHVKSVEYAKPAAETNSGSKAIIIVAVGLLVVVLSVFKIINSGASSATEQPEEVPYTQPEPEPEFGDSLALADSVAAIDTVVQVAEPLPATKDSLRFECFPTQTDSVCAVTYSGQRYNFRRFTIVRNVPHNDSARVVIAVPSRTKMFINGVKTEYGINNTIVLYGGEVVRKYNSSKY